MPGKEEIKRIKLQPPELSKKKILWNKLTWWRPLTKKEARNFSLMILKISEAVINLERIQKKLIKNNNLIMQQIQGYQMAKAIKEKEEKKRFENDEAFQ